MTAPAPHPRKSALRALWTGFRRRQDASVAVETALLLPVALAFMSCLTMLSEGMEVLGKVNLAASTIGNIVTSQASPLNLSMLNCIMGAAAPVIAPWDATKGSIAVSEVQVDATGQNGVVQWSQSLNGAATLAADASVPLPAGSAAPAGSYLILTTVNYKFTPIVFVPVNFASFTVSRSLYLPVLNNGAINLNTSS